MIDSQNSHMPSFLTIHAFMMKIVFIYIYFILFYLKLMWVQQMSLPHGAQLLETRECG